MVEVFTTDVKETTEADKLLNLLAQHFPHTKINFDLDDCDRILRMEGVHIPSHRVIMLVNENGFKCTMLE